ncbi:MAG TPA: alpha/beta hydrolase, partial [Chitinophagaceae bacterium]|nr:alpha/beta hydrolase [Chitinophagaceae bacterium]
MKTQLFPFYFLILCNCTVSAQPSQSLQDPTLNNLVYPKEYKTCKLGELGAVVKTGSGKQSMILIPGLGFGSNEFKSFIHHYKDQYIIYTITPAGFAGTPGPPMPDTSIKYIALTWTNGIVTGVLDLIEKEKLHKPIIVASFVTATQVALDLAQDYPDEISSIIIIGGSPYRFYPGQKKDGTYSDWENEIQYTPEQRKKAIEFYWAPIWF